MIGNNEMILNTATVIEAMQEWLDKRMAGFAPRVTNVRAKDPLRGTFEITLNEKETLE